MGRREGGGVLRWQGLESNSLKLAAAMRRRRRHPSRELTVTTLARGALVTSPNGTYHANDACQCKAFVNGHKKCKNRAAACLIKLYESVPPSKPTRSAVAPRQPQITRSVERDRFGRRFNVSLR